MFSALKRIFKSYFIAGLLLLGPLVISIYVLRVIIQAADSTLRTSQWLPVPIPGLGVLIGVCLILVAGFVGKNYLGRILFSSAGELFSRIPLVGAVYSSTRQVFETLLGSSNRQFGRVVIIPYPNDFSWTLAFVTAENLSPEIQSKFSEKMISVYVPTTPVPTAGFYLYVPTTKTISTSMSVDDAFKIIISIGLAQPQTLLKKE